MEVSTIQLIYIIYQIKFMLKHDYKFIFYLGRGSAGSSSNAIPLGSGRAGIGSVGSQIPPPPQLSTSSKSGRSNTGGFQSKFQMNFQKASSSESELGLLRSSNTGSSSTTSPSGKQQRKRRWDS